MISPFASVPRGFHLSAALIFSPRDQILWIVDISAPAKSWENLTELLSFLCFGSLGSGLFAWENAGL